MLLINNNSKGSYVESFKAINTSIRYYFKNEDKKAFVITSANANEGKTNIAINLAISLANDEMKTLLVDCTFKNPKVDKVLKLDNSIGITDVLIGKKQLDDVINKYKENLHVLPSGNTSLNSTDLLGTSKMKEIIEKLKERYDYIIIDSPQMLKFSDSRILSSICDGVILVASYANTQKESLCECKKIIDYVGGCLTGVVINGVKD